MRVHKLRISSYVFFLDVSIFGFLSQTDFVNEILRVFLSVLPLNKVSFNYNRTNLQSIVPDIDLSYTGFPQKKTLRPGLAHKWLFRR